MGKKTIQEIASILVQRNGLKVRDAERFAATVFSVIREGLERDGQVKVRGLGTFKIVGVGARESVSVSTGERVTIAGHDKISFTPDATMKELVNKPFSQFETVVLNEGVDFEEDAPESLESAEVPEIPEIPETPVVPEPKPEPKPEPQPEPKPEPVTLMTAVEPEAPNIPEAPEEPKPKAPNIPVTPVTPETPETPEEPEEPEGSNTWKWVLGVIGVLLLMAASAGGGYYFGLKKGQQIVTADSTAVAVVPDTAVIDTAAVDTTAIDTTTIVVEEQPVTEPVTEPASEAAPEPKPEPAPDKYAEMDPRVKHGAYRIIGDDFTVTVKPGETTARIAKRTLGAGMECYIEVYNGIKSNADLKEGQTVMIPKLEWKKKKK